MTDTEAVDALINDIKLNYTIYEEVMKNPGRNITDERRAFDSYHVPLEQYINYLGRTSERPWTKFKKLGGSKAENKNLVNKIKSGDTDSIKKNLDRYVLRTDFDEDDPRLINLRNRVNQITGERSPPISEKEKSEKLKKLEKVGKQLDEEHEARVGKEKFEKLKLERLDKQIGDVERKIKEDVSKGERVKEFDKKELKELKNKKLLFELSMDKDFSEQELNIISEALNEPSTPKVEKLEKLSTETVPEPVLVEPTIPAGPLTDMDRRRLYLISERTRMLKSGYSFPESLRKELDILTAYKTRDELLNLQQLSTSQEHELDRAELIINNNPVPKIEPRVPSIPALHKPMVEGAPDEPLLVGFSDQGRLVNPSPEQIERYNDLAENHQQNQQILQGVQDLVATLGQSPENIAQRIDALQQTLSASDDPNAARILDLLRGVTDVQALAAILPQIEEDQAAIVQDQQNQDPGPDEPIADGGVKDNIYDKQGKPITVPVEPFKYYKTSAIMFLRDRTYFDPEVKEGLTVVGRDKTVLETKEVYRSMSMFIINSTGDKLFISGPEDPTEFDSILTLTNIYFCYLRQLHRKARTATVSVNAEAYANLKNYNMGTNPPTDRLGLGSVPTTVEGGAPIDSTNIITEPRVPTNLVVNNSPVVVETNDFGLRYVMPNYYKDLPMTANVSAKQLSMTKPRPLTGVSKDPPEIDYDVRPGLFSKLRIAKRKLN